MKVANIQKMLATNRKYITGLHESIVNLKTFKAGADLRGDVQREFDCHNDLKKYRKELAKLVDIQKDLKALLKEAK